MRHVPVRTVYIPAVFGWITKVFAVLPQECSSSSDPMKRVRSMPSQSKKITTCAALTATGLILGYIESFIVLPVGIPGIRLGLANIVSIFALYIIGPAYAFFVLLVRVMLSSILFSGPAAFAYSMAGAVVSMAVMILIRRLGFSIYSVSVAGAVTHNIAQIIVAAFITNSRYVFFYTPVLVLSGIAAGLVTGFIVQLIIKRLAELIEDEKG